MNKAFLLFLYIITHTSIAQVSHTIEDIPKELRENANSVVLEDKTEIDVSTPGKQSTVIKRAVAILNKLGDRHIDAHVYYDTHSKVKNIEAYVYDENGKELNHFKQRDFRDVSAVSGFSLYEDDRMLYLDYTPTVYPYIMVFTSEVYDDSTLLPKWLPTDRYVSSTLKSELTITFDPANKPRYQEKFLSGHDITITEAPGKISCVAKNMRAVRYEETAPPFLETAAQVAFAQDVFYLKGVRGTGKNWSEFGSWMDESLLQGTTELAAETINHAKNLVKNETTNEGKARKIYEYLQNKVRYISVQIGIGGWKPMLASEVDKLGYGDCKALTNYTKALLDAVGVPSYYTILYLDDVERSIETDFATIQGNHAILGVPDNDEIIWLECTSQELPFGYVSNNHDDRDVLIITPEGGKVVRTKAYKVNENSQVSTGYVHLNSKGGIQAGMTRVSKGLQYGNKYGISELTDRERDEVYKRNWGHINGFALSEVAFDNDKMTNTFTETLSIQASNYAMALGNDLLLCVNVFNRSDHIPPRISERKQQVYLPMNFIDSDEIEISIPEGFRFDGLPETKNIANEFGNYTIDFVAISENKIKYKREFILKKGSYPAASYTEYRSFRRTVSKLDKTKILVTKI